MEWDESAASHAAADAWGESQWGERPPFYDGFKKGARWAIETFSRPVEPRASEVTDGNLQEAVEIYIQGIRRNESVQSFVTRIANAAKFGGRS